MFLNCKNKFFLICIKKKLFQPMTTLKIEKKIENKQNDNDDNRRRKKYHQQVKKIN